MEEFPAIVPKCKKILNWKVYVYNLQDRDLEKYRVGTIDFTRTYARRLPTMDYG